MKNSVLVSLFVATTILFSACNTNDEVFGFNDILGTYVGAMNVDTPSFSNAQYNVRISKVSSSVVRIEPLGAAGSQWTANMTKVAGIWTCISCATNNQITVTQYNNSIQLGYNYDDNNEQFAGVKQ